MLPSGFNILIDASTDLRHQALKWDLEQVHAVLLTHAHADHIMGLDDLRAFNFTTKLTIPIFAAAETSEVVRRTFAYVFNPDPNYPGGLLPKLSLEQIREFVAFEVGGQKIEPFSLEHGPTQVLGFRFGEIAYATDCKLVPERSREVIKGARYLILDGLRNESHRTHMTISEAVKCAEELGVEKTYLTHMTHSIDYHETMKLLPPHVELAYDGLEIVV